MNWGTKIILGLGSFMLFIIASSIYMVTKDSDSLIDEDYYENSLNYDEVYNRKQNLINDDVSTSIVQREDTLHIQFNSGDNKGELIFRRPSDGSMDRAVPFYTATNMLKLPILDLQKGNWSLELNWENSGKKYIQSQAFYIQ